MSWKWPARAGAVCLLVGSVAMFLQHLVTPVSGGDDAATQVAMVSAHMSAMGWALALDAPNLLVVPGVLFIGWLAGARNGWLPAVGTATAFTALLAAATTLVANEVVVYEAARLGSPEATEMVQRYQGNPLVMAMLVVYLIGQPVGFILIAASLRRRRAVRLWSAVALAAYPFLEFVGTVTGIAPLATAAYALVVVGFATCAVALLQGRAGVSGAVRQSVTPARVAVSE